MPVKYYVIEIGDHEDKEISIVRTLAEMTTIRLMLRLHSLAEHGWDSSVGFGIVASGSGGNFMCEVGYEPKPFVECFGHDPNLVSAENFFAYKMESSSGEAEVRYANVISLIHDIRGSESAE